MWSDIVKQLGQFPNAVLTGKDRNGYPFSIRCTPQVDEDQQVLIVPPFSEEHIQEGPAGLLYHSHNEALWDLKSVQILGELRQTEGKWVFYPERFIAGAGLQGPLDQMRQLFKARADAQRYLEKRGLLRPKVRWDEIEALKAEIKNSKG
jgi:hypothetical protein